MKRVIVVGGGAAGLLAAISAAYSGASVTILEKMNRAGKKLLITGKGRCNITNNTDINGLIKNITGNGAFLYSSLHGFSNADVAAFFERLGVPTKVERGGRVFPVSDKAADVVGALLDELRRLAVTIKYECAARSLIVENGVVTGVVDSGGERHAADAVILAAGGASYPATGSSGDGYKMAAAVGHCVTELRPSLVPLETAEEWVREAQGLSLKNVSITVLADGIKKAQEFGEMLFTHYGVSGPIILSASRAVTAALQAGQAVDIVINLKPALSREKLDLRVQRDFAKNLRRQVKNSLFELLPRSLVNIIIDLAYLDPDKQINQITKTERARLVDTILNLTLTVVKARPLSEAIVTAGGVSVKEINPKTMESKLVKGLFFAGEVIDVDGYTGGFNLQAAFSTGYAAGRAAAD